MKRIPRYLHGCLRCGRQFESSNPKPLRCAKCRTPYWSRPREKERKKNDAS